MRRLTAPLCLLLLTAACGGPYAYVKKAEDNPMAGQTIFMQGSLVFSDCDVDGIREDVWLAGEGEGSRNDWATAQSKAGAEFARSLQSQLSAQGIKMTPQANPQGAKLLLNPRVKKVETGGLRAAVVVVSVKVIDDKGTVVEEISTKAKSTGGAMKFDDRLTQAALVAAGNIAGWVTERTGATAQ
jgi:hypothetical protein